MTQAYLSVSKGENEFSQRDHITLVLHYGQLDRWVSSEKGDVVINSDNADTIAKGQVVKLSETLFMKWIKLTTMVDRSKTRKEDFHVKNKVTSIAKMLGYSHKRGLYNVLKPLYEVGLIDMKEATVGSSKMIDIIVYPYPVDAQSPLCSLSKIRSWSERESFGQALSNLATASRKKSNAQLVKKSSLPSEEIFTEGSEEKFTEPSEEIFTEGSEEKFTSLVKKSSPTNINNITNIYKSTNDNKSSNHQSVLDHKIHGHFMEFIVAQKMTDEEKKMMIDRLIDFKPISLKAESLKKYFSKTLESIREEVELGHYFACREKRIKRKGSLPKWLVSECEQEENHMTVEEKIEFERQKQEFEAMLARKGEAT